MDPVSFALGLLAGVVLTFVVIVLLATGAVKFIAREDDLEYADDIGDAFPTIHPLDPLTP